MIELEQVRVELENNKAILLDVREQEEWEKGHLPLARLIPLSQLDKGIIPKDLPQDKIIYIHCYRGGRAEYAAQTLKEHYSFVIPLKYSLEVLKSQRYPLGTVQN